MVTGVESIGLALAVFPLLIHLVETWKGLGNRDIRFLEDTLRTTEQIFRNSVMLLLKSVVPASEVRILLANEQENCWKDPGLSEKVTRYLGADANSVLAAAQVVHKTMYSLKKELKKVEPKSIPSATRAARAKLVIKAFVHGKSHRASLEKLRMHVEDFRRLADGFLRLITCENADSVRFDSIQNLRLVQESANYLYDALLDGWNCDCITSHPTHIQLGVWTASPQANPAAVCIKFRLLFAANVEEARATHWRCAEFVPIASSQHTSFIPSSRSVGSVSHSGPVPPDTHVSILSGAVPQHQSTLVDSVNATHSMLCDNTVNARQISADSDIGDLCMALDDLEMNSAPQRRRMGSLSSDGDTYDLFVCDDQVKPPPQYFSMSMSDALISADPPPSTGHQRALEPLTVNLNNKDRIRLGLMLAWAVLQLSPTRWLSGHWTRENILLVMDPASNPEPYVSHGFPSARRSARGSNASTLRPQTSNNFGDWVKSSALFPLAVFLLEMGYQQSIEDLAVDEEKNASGLTPLLTAQRLAKQVHDRLGVQYARAVDACLNPNLESCQTGGTLDPESMAQVIMDQIIAPLESVATTFGVNMPMIMKS